MMRLDKDAPLGRTDPIPKPKPEVIPTHEQPYENSTPSQYVDNQQTVQEIKPVEDSQFSLGWKDVNIDLGVGLDKKAIDSIITKLPDYSENKDQYESYSNLSNLSLKRYNGAAERNIFALDKNGNIIPGENHFFGAEALFFDKEALKGALLLKRNGKNKDSFIEAFGKIYQEEKQAIEEKRGKKTSDILGYAAGTIASYAADPATAIDLMSPQNIIGKTILKGAIKSAGIEFAHGLVSETARQIKMDEVRKKASLDTNLWDETKQVLLNAGLAGLFRGIGSAVVDIKTFNKIKGTLKTKSDQEVFERFAQRENYKLTKDTRLHETVLEKVMDDMNEGKKVDIENSLDMTVDEKLKIMGNDEVIEPVSFENEIAKIHEATGDLQLEKQLNDTIDATTTFKESLDNPYEGLVEPKEAEELISTYKNHPEIADEIEAIRIEEEAYNKSLQDLQANPRYEEHLKNRENVLAKDIQYEQTLVSKRGATETGHYGGVYEPNYKADFELTKNDVRDLRAGKASEATIQKLENDLGRLENDPRWAEVQDDIVTDFLDDGLKIDEKGNLLGSDGKVLFSTPQHMGVGALTGTINATTNADANNDGIVTQEELMTAFIKGFVGGTLGSKGLAKILSKVSPKTLDKIASIIETPSGGKKASMFVGKNHLHIKKEIIDKTTRDANFKKWFNGSKVVDEQGEPLVVYHGTASDIKEFKEAFIGKGNDQYGSGFYFTTKTETADRYAGSIYAPNVSTTSGVELSKKPKPNIIPVFLDIKKPIIIDEVNKDFEQPSTITLNQIKQLINKAYKPKYALSDWGDISYDGYEKVLNDAAESYVDIGDLEIMNQISLQFYDGEEAKFNKIFKEVTGYDGVEINFGDEKHFVVFEPNKIKSVNNNGAFSKDGNILKGALLVPAIGTIASQKKETN